MPEPSPAAMELAYNIQSVWIPHCENRECPGCVQERHDIADALDAAVSELLKCLYADDADPAAEVHTETVVERWTPREGVEDGGGKG